MNIPRSEHPKPQFLRESWENLNGEWEYEFDFNRSGKEKNYQNRSFDNKITVPFCPQSKLSGVEYTDFIPGIWYRRSVNITKEQTEGNIFIHFGAVDYHTEVFVNGKFVGSHDGGYVSFKFDITAYLSEGENSVCVYAEDDEKSNMIPKGKQSDRLYHYDCLYTRTTGIWQTVWLEFTPESYIDKVKFYPDSEGKNVRIDIFAVGDNLLEADVEYNGKRVGGYSGKLENGKNGITISLSETHFWEPGKGNLYDVVFRYGEDTVKSYFGIRTVNLSGRKFLLNGKSVFQRFILDQGFYPDGIYTAPDDSELVGDIRRSIELGFNGARLHEKVFEERFLYYCDKLGYMVWGEYPNWGLDHTNLLAVNGILSEWLEEIDRDFNHPAIIGWCPFNETWDRNEKKQSDELLQIVFNATKAADDTRPCIDTSGVFHVKKDGKNITDIYDVHNYTQNKWEIMDAYGHIKENGTIVDHIAKKGNTVRQEYDGVLPLFISEYGGISWTKETDIYGYGKKPEDLEEFYDRFSGLTEALLDNDCIMGFCYTQLTDVEQEQNGLYTYDRRLKFDKERIKKSVSKKAAIED